MEVPILPYSPPETGSRLQATAVVVLSIWGALITITGIIPAATSAWILLTGVSSGIQLFLAPVLGFGALIAFLGICTIGSAVKIHRGEPNAALAPARLFCFLAAGGAIGIGALLSYAFLDNSTIALPLVALTALDIALTATAVMLLRLPRETPAVH